jgi:hypothetical protein
MTEVSSLESAILVGAVAALRRAARQIAKARSGTARTERDVRIKTGEAAVAERLAKALADAAD